MRWAPWVSDQAMEGQKPNEKENKVKQTQRRSVRISES
jgi:hypothetical protein